MLTILAILFAAFLTLIGLVLIFAAWLCCKDEPISPEARAVRANPPPEPAPYKLVQLPCGKYLVQMPDGKVLFAPWGVTAAQAAMWWGMENESQQHKETAK